MPDCLLVGCLGGRCPRQINFVAFSLGMQVGDWLRKRKGRRQRDSRCAAAVEQGRAEQAENDGRNSFGGSQNQERIRREDAPSVNREGPTFSRAVSLSRI